MAAIDRVWKPRMDDVWSALEVSRQMDAQRAQLHAETDEALKALGPRPTLEEFERVIEKQRRAEAPFWEIKRRRDEQEKSDKQSDKLPFGDLAMERLQELRLARDDIRKRHGGSSPEYLAFMRGTFLPWYNTASTEDRMCERCFALFALTDARARFCSDNCSAAVRMRGRRHDGLSEAAKTERVKRRAAREIDEHVLHCRNCQTVGQACTTRERILGRQEAYTQSWSDEALEAASARQARRRR